MALERKVTVRVDLVGGGNLAQKMRENERQAQQLQAAMAKQQVGAAISPSAVSQQSRRGPTVTPAGFSAAPPAAAPAVTRQPPPVVAQQQPRQQPATVQDRFAQRLATRGQRAEFIGGEGAALFQQVALQEERVRGEQRVAQARAALINMNQPEEAAQVRLETLLGSQVEKQRQILNLRARASIMAGPERGIFEQVAGLNAINAAQQAVIQSRGQLYAMQSPRGRAALIQQASLTQTIGREQRVIDYQARYGQGVGRAAALGMEMLPIAGAVAAAVVTPFVLLRGAISGLPVVSQQLDNSMASLRNEIGISLIPVVKSLSGVFQQASGVMQRFNEIDRRTGGGVSSGFGLGVVGPFMGAAGAVPPKLQIDLSGQRGDLGAGVEAAQLAFYQGTEDQRRQEAEAWNRMANTMENLDNTIKDRVPPREGL